MEEFGWLSDPQIVMSGIGGVFFGLLFPVMHAWWRRRKERLGELHALNAELCLAAERMTALPIAGITAPLYHLPLTMFGLAAPRLIGEGHLNQMEITALVEYMARAEELNRGLERARAAHAAHGEIETEYQRNCEKAKGILNTKIDLFGGVSLVDAVRGSIGRLHDRLYGPVSFG